MRELIFEKELLEKGREQGLEQGIQALILDNLEEQVQPERILAKLQKRFNISRAQAEAYWKKYGEEV